MSTHRLDVSGARALTTVTNDPAATIAQTPANAGDDATVMLSAKEIRLALAGIARIERRRYIRQRNRRENGELVKVNGEYVLDDVPEEELVLVISGNATLFMRSSFSDEEKAAAEAEGRTLYESHPHTSVQVKRWKEQHFLEQGELLETFIVSEVTAPVTGGSDEVGTPDTLTPKG